MKHLTTIGLALLVLNFSSVVVAQPSSSQPSYAQLGKLSVVVLDEAEQRVPWARIFIEGKGVKREISSASDGNYEINLPKGKYKIRIKCDGFLPSKEKTVRVTSNSTTTLNITLIVGHAVPHPPIIPI